MICRRCIGCGAIPAERATAEPEAWRVCPECKGTGKQRIYTEEELAQMDCPLPPEEDIDDPLDP